MQNHLEYAVAIAREAGNLTLDYFNNPELVIEQKSDQTPVTAADRGAELLLRERIAERFPDDAILGEEFPSDEGTSGYRWILDPIDGTKSFIPRVPLYGLLIGLLHEGKPLLGLIEQPVTRQRVCGDGLSTSYNGAPAHVSQTRRLADALLLTTDIANVAKHQDRAAFDRLADSVYLFRTWGDCYGHLMVAAGLADIMADPVLNLWDVVPLLPILTGAGAVVTDWRGGDALTSRNVIAANPWLHEQVLAVLR